MRFRISRVCALTAACGMGALTSVSSAGTITGLGDGRLVGVSGSGPTLGGKFYQAPESYSTRVWSAASGMAGQGHVTFQVTVHDNPFALANVQVYGSGHLLIGSISRSGPSLIPGSMPAADSPQWLALYAGGYVPYAPAVPPGTTDPSLTFTPDPSDTTGTEPTGTFTNGDMPAGPLGPGEVTTITSDEQQEAAAVPLPSGVWSGLGLLALLAVPRFLRRSGDN